MRLVSFRFSIVSLCFTHKKFDSRWLHLIPILGSLCKQKSRSCSLPVVTTPQYWGIVNDMSTKAWPIFLWQILVPHSERVVLNFLARTVSILSCLAKLDQFGSFHGVILATKTHGSFKLLEDVLALCQSFNHFNLKQSHNKILKQELVSSSPKCKHQILTCTIHHVYNDDAREKKYYFFAGMAIQHHHNASTLSMALTIFARSAAGRSLQHAQFRPRFGDTFRTKQKHQLSSGANQTQELNNPK